MNYQLQNKDTLNQFKLALGQFVMAKDNLEHAVELNDSLSFMVDKIELVERFIDQRFHKITIDKSQNAMATWVGWHERGEIISVKDATKAVHSLSAVLIHDAFDSELSGSSLVSFKEARQAAAKYLTISTFTLMTLLMEETETLSIVQSLNAIYKYRYNQKNKGLTEEQIKQRARECLKYSSYEM